MYFCNTKAQLARHNTAQMAKAKLTVNFKEITDFLNHIHPISNETTAYLVQQCSYFHVKKGKFLRSPIDNTETLYFIVKGLVRGFIKEDGDDITTWLNEENNIVGSVRNLGLDVETEEYIQALEDSTLIGIEQSALDAMYDRYYEANIIGRKILERYYRDADERAFLCRLPSAEKRFRRFVATRSSLLGRVKLKYIASYLNMKLETLCRIKVKVES
ncbi:Crp/Fnr family transcriptional regulator [Sphingobacterium deserti]|uniref:Putative Crp/Fnr family transcriptional regulator n=1 Tax=Sphingobacterium deserti TaxID=1229276 RepID=A0A0B8T882_9SPHI|nr:cyclic nucleotide-binding domain-containing protein [Sphingobacterium deserti]KGE14135.1 putative Crp/Fnr family transcriptional regulator [Sphingobacterium deserti]